MAKVKLKRKKNIVKKRNIVKGNPNIKDRATDERNIKGNPNIFDSRFEYDDINKTKRSLTAESRANEKLFKALEKKSMKKKGRLVSKD
tara:strand:+ start:74 stop:337 length:264 start_codon:yes stop_codon:yes gene_type:complete